MLIPDGQIRGRHGSDLYAGLALHVLGRADDRHGYVERIDTNIQVAGSIRDPTTTFDCISICASS